MGEVVYEQPQTLSSGRLGLGVVDGPADTLCPEGACLRAQGFDFRRGYARARLTVTQTTAADILSGSDVRDLLRWVRSTGTTRFYALSGGYLWESATNAYGSLTCRSDISYGSTTATRATLVVTLAAGAKALQTLQAGDLFFYDADGASSGGLIASVDSDTQVTLASYAGAGTSGNCTVRRKFATTDGHLIVAGDRVWVFDGTNIPHWYGDCGGSDILREAGLPTPTSAPAAALAATGALQAGVYSWAWAYRDADGRTGNPIYGPDMTAAANDAATVTGFANGPEWATQIDIFRCKVDQQQWYCVYKDVSTKLKTVTGTGPCTLTLVDDASPLVTDSHIDRYVTFAATGNTYLITDNDGTTITVSGNASGESGTDDITITGGFDLDQLVAGSYVDVIDDDDLDITYEAPDENGQPPAGLTAPCLIDGGARLVAVYGQTQMYLTGRSDEALIPEGAARGGLAEWDYWSNLVDVGTTDGDQLVAFLALGQRLFGLKTESIWEIYKKPQDVLQWDSFPFEGGEGIGCVSSYSIAKKASPDGGVAFWLGTEDGQVDVIRFDGNSGFGMLRQFDPRLGTTRNRVIPDNMTSADTRASGAVFRGTYWLAYRDTSVGGAVHNSILHYDLKCNAVDVSIESIGQFARPYSASGTPVLLGTSAATDASDVFTVDTNSGANVSRTLIPRAFTFGSGTETYWSVLRVSVLNEEALNSSRLPSLLFSIDGKPFDDSTKTWTALSGDEDWPATTGEDTARAEIVLGQQSRVLHIKLTCTDQEAWGILDFEVDCMPVKQDMNVEP